MYFDKSFLVPKISVLEFFGRKNLFILFKFPMTQNLILGISFLVWVKYS